MVDLGFHLEADLGTALVRSRARRAGRDSIEDGGEGRAGEEEEEEEREGDGEAGGGMGHDLEAKGAYVEGTQNRSFGFPVRCRI